MVDPSVVHVEKFVWQALASLKVLQTFSDPLPVVLANVAEGQRYWQHRNSVDSVFNLFNHSYPHVFPKDDVGVIWLDHFQLS